MNFLRVAVIALLLITIASCGLMPAKTLPEGIGIEFLWNNFSKKSYSAGGLKPAFRVNNNWIYAQYDRSNHNTYFMDREFGVIFRTECQGSRPYNTEVHLCKVFQKISGNRLHGEKQAENINEKEWQLLGCGLYTDHNVQSGDCDKLKTARNEYIDKLIIKDKAEQIEKQARIKEEQSQRAEERLVEEERKKNAPKDSAGREIIRGPVSSGIYSNVHIISDSIGVNGFGPTMISDSVIEAPICVRSTGQGLSLQNNVLNCDLCVEFMPGALMNNSLISNQCAGRLSNRPDIF